jgi:zinc transport system permease protein
MSLPVFDHDFMRLALFAILAISPIFGLLGTMVVQSRLAFFSDALGHSALTGVAIGALLGLSNPGFSVLAFALAFAFAVYFVKSQSTASPDTAISVLSSAALALGIVILSRGGGFSRYSAYLVGDLLTISPSEAWMLVGLAVAVLALWLLFYNPLLLFSVHPALAKSRGIPIKLYELGFMLVVAAVVALTVRWVGILVITAMLVLPAAAARNVAHSTRSYHLLSVAFALVSGIVGLFLSLGFDTAAGATVVLILFACWLGTAAVRGMSARR